MYFKTVGGPLGGLLHQNWPSRIRAPEAVLVAFQKMTRPLPQGTPAVLTVTSSLLLRVQLDGEGGVLHEILHHGLERLLICLAEGSVFATPAVQIALDVGLLLGVIQADPARLAGEACWPEEFCDVSASAFEQQACCAPHSFRVLESPRSARPLSMQPESRAMVEGTRSSRCAVLASLLSAVELPARLSTSTDGPAELPAVPPSFTC